MASQGRRSRERGPFHSRLSRVEAQTVRLWPEWAERETYRWPLAKEGISEASIAKLAGAIMLLRALEQALAPDPH